jgi:hypothetical protein
MKLRRTSVRRRSVATLAVAAAAIVAAFVLPAAALADHQAQMASTASTVAPGCQAKGVFAQPAPAGPAGTLTTGAYAYVVTATYTGVDETTPCPPAATFVFNNGSPTAFNSVQLQWNAVPGAVGYHVYRAPINAAGQPTAPFHRLTFGPGTTLPTSACPRAVTTNYPGQPQENKNGSGNGSRCDVQDVGTDSGVPLTTPIVAASTQAGAAVDLKLTQCVDYGGSRSACPFSPPLPGAPAIDDPTNATTDGNALKTDLLHFPAGLNARPLAAAQCKLTGAAPSLMGDPNKRGSQDPDEDTCGPESLVGNATTLSRTGNSDTYSLTRGDIYLATPQAGEAARLFIILRPTCSAGAPSPYNPGGSVCTTAFGGPGAGGDKVEVEKEFLAASSNFVKRTDSSGNITYGIDVNTIEAATGGPLPDRLAVLAPVGPGGAFVTATTIGVQVHQLTQTLFGTADQGTQDTGDDKTFLTLPTSCGDHALSADKTTYNDGTVSSASTNVPTTNCEALPFAPKLGAVASGTAASGGHPTLDVTVSQDASEAPSKSVKVTLPASLGTNLAALNNTCTEAELNADTCTKAIGSASASSPISGDLKGNVYLQSVSGALPKLVVKLKGLINLDLVGTIDLAGGSRIVNLFSSIPDVPLTSFLLRVNGGDNGLLTNLSNLCEGIGNADGEFTAHSGKTATASAPVQLTGVDCTPTSTGIGTSKRSKVKILMAKVKSGHPTLDLTVTRGSSSIASRIKTVRLTLPKSLKIVRNDALESRLGVRAFPDLMPITQLTVRARLLGLTGIPGGPVTKVREVFRQRALKESNALKKQGKKARVTFKLRVTTQGNKAYSYKITVKPKS